MDARETRSADGHREGSGSEMPEAEPSAAQASPASSAQDAEGGPLVAKRGSEAPPSPSVRFFTWAEIRRGDVRLVGTPVGPLTSKDTQTTELESATSPPPTAEAGAGSTQPCADNTDQQPADPSHPNSVAPEPGEAQQTPPDVMAVRPETPDGDAREAAEAPLGLAMPAPAAPRRPRAKRMTSRQIAANRRNAQRSTGPRSAAGKVISRGNAIKHGLLAAEVIVPAVDGCRARAAFRRFLTQLRAEWQPVGLLEGICLEQLAVAHWRRRRVLLAESGEIQRGVLEVTTPTDVEYLTARYGSDEPNKLAGAELRSLLQEAREEIIKTDRLSSETRDRLASDPNTGDLLKEYFDFRKTADAVAEAAGGAAPAGDGPKDLEDEDDGQEDLEEVKEGLLELFRREARAAYIRVAGQQAVRQRRVAAAASAAIPSGEVADRLCRYESMIERQFSRALAELERLQRHRLGDFVPPPITVHLAGGQ